MERKNLDEKWLLEEAAAQYFVETLNEDTGSSYGIVSHGDRPDIVIRDTYTGHFIGVEVTHLFYDDEEARVLLGRAAVKEHGGESIETYIARLNQLLQQKAEKTKNYSFRGDLGLLIRVASPIFSRFDFERCQELIKVPPNDYKHIWLLFYDFTEKCWCSLKWL